MAKDCKPFLMCVHACERYNCICLFHQKVFYLVNPVIALTVSNTPIECITCKNKNKVSTSSDTFQQVLVKLSNRQLLNINKYRIANDLQIDFDQTENRNNKYLNSSPFKVNLSKQKAAVSKNHNTLYIRGLKLK